MLLKKLKNAAKAVISPMVDATGLYERRLQEAAATPDGWTVVMYHRVIEDPALDPFELGMCVLVDRFDRQMRYLASRFNVIPVLEGVRRLQAGQSLPERALSITFDDGYLDTLTTALPVMERLSLPPTVFVPTGGLDSGEPLWWDRVIGAIACTDQLTLDLQGIGLSLQPELLALTGMGRSIAVERVLDRLWSLDYKTTIAVIERIERQLRTGSDERVVARRLSPEQVLELHRRGVEIGAHSVHHPNLELATEEFTQREMVESRQYLEELLQSSVTGFAYPGGRMRRETANLARELGFAYSMSTNSGINRPPYDRYVLRRIGMPNSKLADFRRAVSNAMTRRTSDAGRTF